MISADCDSVRDDLDAFVDGELRGAELRRVAQHLETCKRCADEIETRENLGGLIRESVSGAYQSPLPTGLAAGVVARTRAESYFSWRAGLGRAVEDWHWVIVGGGAVSATLLSMLFCSALLVLGTAKLDGDSLSALGTNLRSSPGQLYAEVSRPGGDEQGVVLVRLDTGDPSDAALPEFLHPNHGEEQRLLEALRQALVRSGPFIQSEAERRHVELLMDTLARVRRAEPQVTGPGSLTVYRLRLVTTTDVTAKGLE
jgi:Putative zinc-finger